MEALRALEGIRSPFLDTLMSYATMLGEETVVIVVLCTFFWCISKRTAYIIAIAYFLSSLTVQGMKICFRIDRPWVIDPTFNPVEAAREHATGYSFPSGHTQSATALFGALGVQSRQRSLRFVCFFLLVLVAFTRLYLGVHTILDVTVSLIITLLIVIVAVRFLVPGEASKARELILPLVIAALAIAVIIIATVLHSGGIIEQSYVTDCLKAAGVSIGFALGMYIERVYIKFETATKNIAMQVLKLVLGLAGVIAIKEGLKLLIGTSLPADTIRYFLMAIWMTVAYPLIIRQFFAVKPAAADNAE